jgi:hypothetical protein
VVIEFDEFKLNELKFNVDILKFHITKFKFYVVEFDKLIVNQHEFFLVVEFKPIFELVCIERT